MIKFKKGVSVDGITKETIYAMSVAAHIMSLWYDQNLTVTSVCDGKHRNKSKHYIGDAFDMRTWTTPTSGEQLHPDVKHSIAMQLIGILGFDYDIVVERTHIHVEYDPE